MFDKLGIDISYIVIGLAAITLLMIILMIVFMARYRQTEKRFGMLMEGKDAKSMEEVIRKLVNDVNNVKIENRKMAQVFSDINENLLGCYKKTGMVKYDAFKGLTGKLSFVLCLLDEKNHGFMINSMHGNDASYIYMKEVINGETVVALSAEEKKALDSALEYERM